MIVFPFLSKSFDDWGGIDQLQRAVLLVDSPDSRDRPPVRNESCKSVALLYGERDNAPLRGASKTEPIGLKERD